jgi:hypothetical protein
MSQLNRWLLGAALLVVVLAALGVPLYARAKTARPRLMRVGGATNPCTCTHRIEP